MSEKGIKIESFEELHVKMQTMEFFVEWRVTSEFGPETMWSERRISFYLDGLKLNKTTFLQDLQNKLIETIPIPETSKNHIICGEGDITLVHNNHQLKIDYFWDASIPYWHPEKREDGTIIFYP